LALGASGIFAFLVSAVSPADDPVQHDCAPDRLVQCVSNDCGAKAPQVRPVAGPDIAAAPALSSRGRETTGHVVIVTTNRPEKIFVRAFENRGPPAFLFL
jgi:hypothetical protein